MSEHITSTDFIQRIQYWLRLSTFQHGPLTIALLNVLHNKTGDGTYIGVPEDADDLYNYLDTKYRQPIISLKHKGVVSCKQFQLIFPANKKTDSKLFDVTLIVVLITNCTKLAPKSMWKVKFKDNDTSKPANVLFAREWRNYVHHTKAEEIKEQDFNAQWTKGVAIITNLGFCTFDHASLKTTSLDPTRQLVSTGLSHYVSIINENLESLEKNMVDKRELESVRVEMRIYKERLENMEEKLSETRKIPTSEEDDLHEMALPEVLAIIEKYLKEDWKDELFSYRKIKWEKIKHNLLREKREDVIATLRKKRIFKDDGIQVNLSHDTLKVLEENIDARTVKNIIESFHNQMIGCRKEQRDGTIYWSVLKGCLSKAGLDDVIEKIKTAMILTPALNRTDRKYVQPEVLEIIKKSVGDDWKNFQEGSALYIFLSLSHNCIKWKILKEALLIRAEHRHHHRQENVYNEMLNEIYKETLLTCGLKNASLVLKKKYITNLMDWDAIATQDIFKSARHPLLNVPREEAYVDLAIVKAEHMADRWLSARKSDRSFHLDLQYMEKEVISMEKVFTVNDDVVILRGIAGVGKSTFVDTYTLKWAQNQMMCDEDGVKIHFLFKFTCRDLNNTRIESIEKLFQLKYLDDLKISFKDLSEVAQNIIILVDGIDELQGLSNLQYGRPGSREATLRTLLQTDTADSDGLYGHKTIVAGRPESCQVIKNVFKDVKVVDICGFNTASVKKYIKYFFRQDQHMVNQVYEKIIETKTLSAMASIPVYLMVICCMYFDKIDLDKVNTTTEVCSYTCLFFLKNHVQKITKDKGIHEICEDQDVCKLIISLADLSMSTLFENKVIFSGNEVRNLHSPIAIEQTGFIDKDGETLQFKHLFLQQFFCALCIHLTGCFKKFIRHQNFRKECLPIIAGLASIEKSGANGDNNGDAIMYTMLSKLKEFSGLSRWKQGTVSSFFYAGITMEDYLKEILTQIVDNGSIIITNQSSDLLSIFFEYQHDVSAPLLQGKRIYISDLFFHHDIRNALHFITKCSIEDSIEEISFSDLSRKTYPANLIELFIRFYQTQSSTSCTYKNVLKIYEDSSMGISARKKASIKEVIIVLDSSSSVDRELLAALSMEADEVVIHSSTRDIYQQVKSIMEQTESVVKANRKILFDTRCIFPSDITKLQIDTKEKLPPSHFEFLTEASRLDVNSVTVFSHLNITNDYHIDKTLSDLMPLFKHIDMSGNKYLFNNCFNDFLDNIPCQLDCNRFFIKSVNLSRCNLIPFTTSLLLPHITTFESIDLSNNVLSADFISAMIETLKCADQSLGLTLKLSACSLSDQLIVQLVKSCFLFKSLDLSKNQLSSKFDPRVCVTTGLLLSHPLKVPRTSLLLSNCGLTDKHWDYLLIIFLNVYHLDVSFNQALTKIPMMALERQLKRSYSISNRDSGFYRNEQKDMDNNNPDNSKQHQCSNCKDQGESDKVVTKNSSDEDQQLPILRNIEIIGCFDTATSSDIFNEMLIPCFRFLESIDFRHHYLTEHTLKRACQIIANYDVQISHLELSIQRDKDWIELSQCIPRLSKFGAVMTETMSKDSAKCLTKTLKKSKKSDLLQLKEFGVHGCTIADDVMEILFPTLATIPKLSFRDVNMSNASINTICCAIKHFQSAFLESLDLSRCGLTNKHMKRLACFLLFVPHTDLTLNPAISKLKIRKAVLQLEEELKDFHTFQSLKVGNYFVTRIDKE